MLGAIPGGVVDYTGNGLSDLLGILPTEGGLMKGTASPEVWYVVCMIDDNEGWPPSAR